MEKCILWDSRIDNAHLLWWVKGAAYVWMAEQFVFGEVLSEVEPVVATRGIPCPVDWENEFMVFKTTFYNRKKTLPNLHQHYQTEHHRKFQFGVIIYSFIHSLFITKIYIAPLQGYRSTPDPCLAKKKSFEAEVECVRKNPGKQSLRHRKPIPHRGANHRECTGLSCGGTSKGNKE